MADDLFIDEEIKLKLTSKRLNSGRYQVKFHASTDERQDLYGYALVESGETLKSVVDQIKARLTTNQYDLTEKNFHLVNLTSENNSSFLIFK